VLLTRDNLVKLGCSLSGAALALALAHFMSPRVALVLPKPPVPVRVSVKAAPLAAQAVAPAPSPEKELRLKSEKPVEVPKPKPKPRPKPPAPAPAAAPVAGVAVPVAPVAFPDLPTLSQPAFPQVAAAAGAPTLPPLVSHDAPEAPPEDTAPGPVAKTYPETPGGDVLVLGLLVNEHGRVEDSDILVPSSHTLTDISIAMASIGQLWTNLQPPLSPGEKRWIELRIPFARDQERLRTLP
jgi:hypothetical protein